MAKATFNFPLSGSLGNYSFFPMAGAKHLVLRSKGGPTKAQIEKGPQFKRQRENISEFSGCGKAASLIYSAMFGMKPLSDANYVGKLNALSGKILKMDMDHVAGQRSILFSRFGKMLEGFNVNTKNSFDDIVLRYPAYTFSRSNCKATLYFSEMYPNVNLKNQQALPYFRFIGVLGIIPDMIYTKEGYKPANPDMKFHPMMIKTEWIPTNEVYSGGALEIPLAKGTMLDETGSLVLSVGVEFGHNATSMQIVEVKGSGGGKILGVG